MKPAVFIKNIERANGFSLIEIAIVLMIVAILTAYAIPQYMSWSLDAKKARAKQDLATLAEQVSKYEMDQNTSQTKTVVRLKSFNELKGRYMATLEKLRDPWGFEYQVAEENGGIDVRELAGYVIDSNTIEVKIKDVRALPSDQAKLAEMLERERWLPKNTEKITSLIYKTHKSDASKNKADDDIKTIYFDAKNVIYSRSYFPGKIPGRAYPKFVYSRGPNGMDEKGKGDDIKHDCAPLKYSPGTQVVPMN